MKTWSYLNCKGKPLLCLSLRTRMFCCYHILKYTMYSITSSIVSVFSFTFPLHIPSPYVTARMLVGTECSDFIVLVLWNLHWLPISFGVQLEVLVLTFKAWELGTSEIALSNLSLPTSPTWIIIGGLCFKSLALVKWGWCQIGWAIFCYGT